MASWLHEGDRMHPRRSLLGNLTFLLGILALSGCPDPLPPGTQIDASVRPPDGSADGGSNVADQLVSEWSGCMTLEEFNLAKMTDWGTLVGGSGQDCAGCHFNGYEGFMADRDATNMFNGVTTVKQFMLHYFSPDVANHKMVKNTTGFTAVANGYMNHPRFDPVNNAGMTALGTFYTETMLHVTNHTCGPPRWMP
jgi:hypothetical protein